MDCGKSHLQQFEVAKLNVMILLFIFSCDSFLSEPGHQFSSLGFV